MAELIRRLLPYCMRHKRVYVLGTLVVIISNYCAVKTTVWVGRTIDHILGKTGTIEGVWHYILAILLFAIIAAVCQYYTRIFLIGVSRVIEYEFRNDFFRHLTRLSASFYDRAKTGDLISRATTDVDNVRMALGPGIMYPLNALNLIPMTLWSMLQKSHAITGFCFLPMLIVPVLVNIFSNVMYRRSLKIRENFSDFSGRMQDSIAGIRVVKSFVQSDHELDVLDRLSQKNVVLNMALARVQAAFFPLMIPIFVSGVVLIIWLGGRYVATDPALIGKNGMISKGDLIAFVMLYGNLFFPVLGLGWVLSIYQRASASMHRIQLIWKQEPEIHDTEETDPSLTSVRGDIEFRDLTFTYPQTDFPALQGISLHVKRGQTLGVVGSVGSGKSTLAHLIPRLYNPPSGKLLIDGVDIRKYPLSVLRGSIGFVFQETYLFSETIMENIRFGLSGEPSNIESVEAAGASPVEAARLAAIESEILGFPRQYETELGERGINLSGGQKQRVSLARALACNPPILILDDAFAAVDTHTEESILNGLRGVIRERTTILISHRTSTVRLADEIIVLDEGRIAERGTHDQLVALNGLYADIYRRQLLEAAIEGENNTA